MDEHRFPYKWYLKDGYPAKGIQKHGCTVFGTFVCGGGSTMGYKLAGYDHLGGVEIDPKVAEVYKANHNPKHFYIEDIRKFNEREDLPDELYKLDLLDGSPPCSSFSLAGNREKDWGKKKQFREGQELQRLDDLVFEYIETIGKLKPKVALLENVKGLIIGNAKAYAKNMKKAFEGKGYRVQVFLLNAASMGVPQKRERVFFVGLRNDFKMPLLKLEFDERPILFGEIHNSGGRKSISKNIESAYEFCSKHKIADFGKYFEKTMGKRSNFNTRLIFMDHVCSTIKGDCQNIVNGTKGYMNNDEIKMAGSYPVDYVFKTLKPEYLIGMSVPPVMTAQISHQIYEQWLLKIK